MMKAIVYGGPGIRSLKSIPRPKILKPTDAIIKLSSTTICGTDLHISKGDVPACKPGTVLGHEGIGYVHEIGPNVKDFKLGDKVIISCVTSCGSCYYCKKSLQSHCKDGGWILGHKIDGTQAEFVRIPHADHSLIAAPTDVSDKALLMLSDILPTGYEIGVLSADIKEGDTVVIVGCGPVGMACLLTAKSLKPGRIVMVDMDQSRLEAALKFGATDIVNAAETNVAEACRAIAAENNPEREPGVDVAIECVGVPGSFHTCEEIIAPGGRIANVGVHGTKVDLHLEELWIKNIGITTGLVSAYSTSDLLKQVADKSIDAEKLVTHTFKMSHLEEAYSVFSDAAKNKSIKCFIENDLS